MQNRETMWNGCGVTSGKTLATWFLPWFTGAMDLMFNHIQFVVKALIVLFGQSLALFCGVQLRSQVAVELSSIGVSLIPHYDMVDALCPVGQ